MHPARPVVALCCAVMTAAVAMGGKGLLAGSLETQARTSGSVLAQGEDLAPPGPPATTPSAPAQGTPGPAGSASAADPRAGAVAFPPSTSLVQAATSPPGSPPPSEAASEPGNAAAPPPSQKGPGDDALAIGLELLQQGNFKGAGAQFEQALVLDPNNATARSRLSYVRFHQGDYAGAAASAESATALDPSDSLAYLILGRSREALGDSDKAHAAYSAAASLIEKVTTQERLVASALGYYLRAVQRVQRGESQDVENDLKEAILVYPKNGYAHYEYALAVLASGKAVEAVAAFEAAAQACASFQPSETWTYPNRRYFFLDANLQFWHAVALRQSGKLAEALALLDPLRSKVEGMVGARTDYQGSTAARALEGKIDTSFYAAHYEAALVYEAQGEKGSALAAVKKLLKLNIADPVTLQKSRELQKRLK